MRIDRLQLKNFRCFSDITIEFEKNLTVLVAPNGQGKSSILDAIKVAVWPYVAGFDLGATTNAMTGIHIDDVRRTEIKARPDQLRPEVMEPRLPTDILAWGMIRAGRLIRDKAISDPFPAPPGSGVDVEEFLADPMWFSHRYRESINKSTKTKSKSRKESLDLKAVAEAFENRIFSDGDTYDDLPMLGHYGTCRLCSEKKLTTKTKATSVESQSRTFAYRDCLDASSTFKHFEEWFTRVHEAYFQAQIRNLERQFPLNADIPYALIAPFKAVQSAIDAVLKPQTGWHRLEYSAEHQSLVLNHEQFGEMKVEQLSDGIRSILALVGDIAYRCYKLNPHLAEYAPQRTQGIVLIDEVDLHLHPAWQQTVLLSLKEAFKEIQFIVTTHSPQVLTSVDSACIRAVREETVAETGVTRFVIKYDFPQTKGVASADVLSQIMGVNPVPAVEEARWVADYTAMIENGMHETVEGKDLREKLLKFYGPKHPVLLDADRLIRFQSFKLRKNAVEG